MADKTWKAVERAIAKLLGGKRRGADFRGVDAGKTDIILPGYALEVKHSKRPTWTLVRQVLEQAERNRSSPEDISAGIIHPAGWDYVNSFVIIRLETFIGIVKSLDK